jgi:hypothetical protein
MKPTMTDEDNDNLHTNLLASVLHGLAETIEGCLVRLVVTMGEIETGNVHPLIDQGLQGGNVPTGRTESTENLGLPFGRVTFLEHHIEGDVSSTKFRAGCLHLFYITVLSKELFG